MLEPRRPGDGLHLHHRLGPVHRAAARPRRPLPGARRAGAGGRSSASPSSAARWRREALDTRLKLLQAQIEPHFLFNTLANVQALVESGSPQAAPVLKSLIAYLRAAMPRLHAEAATLANEIALVRSYLELMQMRMPDRLTFSIDVPADIAAREFLPMSVLTLVENAIRHGIDPGENGRSHRRQRPARARRQHPRRRRRHRCRHEPVGGARHRPDEPRKPAARLLRRRRSAGAARGPAARVERRDRLSVAPGRRGRGTGPTPGARP